MKLRDARLAVNIYTGAVVVSVAMALASLTWRLLGDPGVDPAAAPVVSRPGVGDDIRPIIAMAPFGVPVAAPPAGAANTALQLRGVLMAMPIEASVALIETEGGATGSYGIGATVGGGVIEAIRADEVAIRTASGLRILAFFPSGGPGTAPGAGAVSGPGAGMTAGGPPAAPAQPGVGFAVGPAPAPQLTAAGLKAGDVVLEVNGTPVGSGANATEALGRAAALGQATIDLIRDGRRVSLTVPIR